MSACFQCAGQTVGTAAPCAHPTVPRAQVQADFSGEDPVAGRGDPILQTQVHQHRHPDAAVLAQRPKENIRLRVTLRSLRALR